MTTDVLTAGKDDAEAFQNVCAVTARLSSQRAFVSLITKTFNVSDIRPTSAFKRVAVHLRRCFSLLAITISGKTPTELFI